MKKNSFIQGTIIASIAIIFVKILGALYVIPFYDIIGEQGGALYSYAYNIYNLFLTISITGFPIAISKLVSEYNEKRMYKAKEKVYKISKVIIGIISIISFLVVFIFAKDIGKIFIGDLEGGNNISDIAYVIRIISVSLLVIPFLSITRGYLQGHKFIKESTNSQIIEQVVRIIIVLAGSYLAINVFNKTIPVGVGYALLGSFFGGLFGLIYLNTKINHNKDKFNTEKENKKEVETKEIVKKFITYAIPSIIIAIASSIYDTVDQILVLRGANMLGFSLYDSEIIASIISTWGVKICMLITAVGTAISINVIPHMVESYVKNDLKEVNIKFNNILKTGLYISLPLAIGVSILSNPLYNLFYGESTYGGLILSVVVFAVVFANFSTILNTALIAINQYKIIYINTFLGIGLNLLLDIPFMILLDKIGIFSIWGASLSTMFSYTISILLTFILLRKKFNFRYGDLARSIFKIILTCLIMLIPLVLLNFVFDFSNYGKLINLIVMIVYAGVGGLTYALVSLKNNLLYEIFGSDVIEKIFIKLHLRKEK